MNYNIISKLNYNIIWNLITLENLSFLSKFYALAFARREGMASQHHH